MTHTKGKLLAMEHTIVRDNKAGDMMAVVFNSKNINIAIKDAEHLVLCWNSHDALADLAKDTVDVIEDLPRGDLSNELQERLHDILNDAEQILKEVTDGQ